MAKRKIHAKTVIEVPAIKCKYCGEPVGPTQKSVERILEKGPKNACPMYICDCEPGDLQVYPQWARRYGYASEN